MRKYILIVAVFIFTFYSCDDFLTLQPEYSINENKYYKTAEDFETALVGTYSELQDLHSNSLLFLTELTTDNGDIQWTSALEAKLECNEMNITSLNSIVNSVWNSCFKIISRSNNILSRIDDVDISETLKLQYKGEALFLRAYCYFYLVRLFGDLPIVEVAFRSPNEVAVFDMARRPVSEVYQLIISDLKDAATLLNEITGLNKSRASTGASKTLLGKVYLTQHEYGLAATVLKEVIDSNEYSLESDYHTLFTNGNDNLPESIFEIEYLSGNIGEGNDFSYFIPSLFSLAMFPGNMNGSGLLVPTQDIRNSYEQEDLRREISILDSVPLLDGTYEHELAGLKFVDFTNGVKGDGGINFTSIRYADVLLMYAEALNETGQTALAHTYINLTRNRAGLSSLDDLSKAELTLALEKERRLEFFEEGHRWFDLLRTGRLQAVVNQYFVNSGNSGFSIQDYELLMPIPQRERNINPALKQNPGY